jgi:hypothetical protein
VTAKHLVVTNRKDAIRMAQKAILAYSETITGPQLDQTLMCFRAGGRHIRNCPHKAGRSVFGLPTIRELMATSAFVGINRE